MSTCTDPNCPHDLLDTCPKELGRAVLEGQKVLAEKRNELYQKLIEPSPLMHKRLALIGSYMVERGMVDEIGEILRRMEDVERESLQIQS